MTRELEDDSATDKRARHRRNMDRRGRCTICPAHRGENATRWKRRSNGKKRKNR